MCVSQHACVSQQVCVTACVSQHACVHVCGIQRVTCWIQFSPSTKRSRNWTRVIILAWAYFYWLSLSCPSFLSKRILTLLNESSKWGCLTLLCPAWGLGKIPPITTSIFSPFHLLIPSSVNKAGRLLVTHSYCKTHDTIPERGKAMIWIRKRKVHCKFIMKSMGQEKEDRWALMLYSLPSFQPEGAMNISFFIPPNYSWRKYMILDNTLLESYLFPTF